VARRAVEFRLSRATQARGRLPRRLDHDTGQSWTLLLLLQLSRHSRVGRDCNHAFTSSWIRRDVLPPLEKARRSPVAMARRRCRTGIEKYCGRHLDGRALQRVLAHWSNSVLWGVPTDPCQPRVRLLCAEVIPTVNPVLTGGVARYFSYASFAASDSTRKEKAAVGLTAVGIRRNTRASR
jgi:hypothetical protein